MSVERPNENGLPIEVLDAEGLLGALVEHGVDFVVIGGLSLAAHGFVRATKDLDVVPDPDPANLARLARALTDLRAEVLVAADFDPGELGIEPDEDGLALGGNWALRTRLGRLDVMQDVPGVRGYAQLATGAVAFTLPGAGGVAIRRSRRLDRDEERGGKTPGPAGSGAARGAAGRWGLTLTRLSSTAQRTVRRR